MIRYNAFKAPEQIYVKDKERISYEYNAFGERSHCYYGNAEVEKAKRPLLKHYSHDGSVEIVCNKTDNSTKFILYLGGDTYSAPAILISNGEASKLYYLHRDYLGSIVMLTDENGNIAERRHFDPWGQPIKVEDGAGNTLDKLTLLDRGYTGHEHLASVGLIHMNGRLYDPALHRFLMPDNYIQDPFNTQNFNRYGYCLNNPLVYVDQDGEWIFLVAAVIGAYIGGAQANGTYNPFKWNYSNADTWMGITGGAIIGVASAGVGIAVGGAVAAELAAVGISGGIIGGAIAGASGGIASGFISGGFMSGLPGGDGDFLGGAGKGALYGGIGGAVIGGAGGGFAAYKSGNNVWTGNPIRQSISPLETSSKGIKPLSIEPENSKIELSLKSQIQHSNVIEGETKLIPVKTLENGIKTIRIETNTSVKLSNAELLRIQNAANRIGRPITVVGSRAAGKAGPYSDWDYVIEKGLNSKEWSKIKNSIPGAKSFIDNTPRKIDIFDGNINRSKPYIKIYPN